MSFAIAAFGNIVAHNIPAAKETVQLGSWQSGRQWQLFPALN